MFSLPHPPYSPDLAPVDVFLFPKMKMQLKRRRFHTVAEIHTHVITHTPVQQLPMLTQRCLLARCLIKIQGHYSCERNPVLPSVGALRS
jgi:transposase